MMDRLNGCIFWLSMTTCNTIWDKVRDNIKKEFDCQPVYNKEFLKTKIKSHCDDRF